MCSPALLLVAMHTSIESELPAQMLCGHKELLRLVHK